MSLPVPKNTKNGQGPSPDIVSKPLSVYKAKYTY